MRTRLGFGVLILPLMLLSSICALAFSGADAGETADKEKILTSYGKLSLYLIENRGQLDPKVRFYTKTSGGRAGPGDISLTYDGIEGLGANEKGELFIGTVWAAISIGLFGY